MSDNKKVLMVVNPKAGKDKNRANTLDILSRIVAMSFCEPRS